MILTVCELQQKTNRQPSIFLLFAPVFFFSLRSFGEKEAKNLIKFLLLSESRADQFITACSQLPFSLPIWRKLNFLRINYRCEHFFSLLASPSLFPSIAQKKSQKCFFMLHKLIEQRLSRAFSLLVIFMIEQKVK